MEHSLERKAVEETTSGSMTDLSHDQEDLRLDGGDPNVGTEALHGSIEEQCENSELSDRRTSQQANAQQQNVVGLADSQNVHGKIVAGHITHMSLNASGSSAAAEADGQLINPWRPAILRMAPLSGLLALTFGALQILASYAVLAASDGDLVENWKYQPSVYLAILVAISNKALAFAAVQGTVVTFWVRVLHGTTLAQMHRDWSYGLHALRALASGRHFNRLALACICATFVAIDGPILQRSSVVLDATPEKPIPLVISITPELPAYYTGFTGIDNSLDHFAGQVRTPFMPVLEGYVGQIPITGAVAGCPGKCLATIQAPALAVDHCTSELIPINMSAPLTPEERQVIEQEGVPATRTIYEIGFSILNGTTERLVFRTKLSDEASAQHCVGHINETLCYLESAIAEYKVVVENDAITFAEPPRQPSIVAKANNTAVTHETVDEFHLHRPGNITWSTLAGIAIIANFKYFGINAMVPTGGGSPGFSQSVSWFMFQHMSNYKEIVASSECPEWRDPRDEIMGSLNELMFRAGVHAAATNSKEDLEPLLDSGLEIKSNVTGTPAHQVTLYAVDYHWFAGAAAVQLFTVLTILFTFWNWWKLGRNASFSPLEIGKAFDAPLLSNVGYNLNGNAIARLESSHQVHYGHPSHDKATETAKLVFTNDESVAQPTGKPITMREYYDAVKAKLPRRRRRHRSAADGQQTREDSV